MQSLARAAMRPGAVDRGSGVITSEPLTYALDAIVAASAAARIFPAWARGRR
jgi:hypothetical protein